MGAHIVDGKSLSLDIQREVAEGVSALNERGVEVRLAVVIAGDDPASHVYVRNKERACERCGILSTRIDMPSTSNLEEMIEVVEQLNSDPSIHGILVQSPAPDGVNELAIASSILPQKDVDGFHPINLGRLVQGDSMGLLPCTPSGVMRMLDSSDVRLEGSRAVVLGRSRIVGMPMALMLAQKGSDATVTIVHSRTSEIESICSEADILVAAVGSAHMVGPQWVKPGAFVVDVGISRIEGGLAGDVAPEVSEIAGWVTPVPGGVGPMTIAMLMKNTLSATEMQTT
ncbi:MAG TPA: bifunctional 5,10-methylenetetrahydrofolate dehydrogenase/5,10-methenyltetrahydrofolate cyclohydrolase [Candidatus Poseidoniales archaeon]|nr:MAG: bifunctional 5,10-methylene-tetrahydrofolate dehydrogenase/5,10-methylene-tetrahydrofolate cyclohydrolase [Euryarchaeota archaeon]HIG33608.1 bifunctional 5,10-methylenetetrahydrofolate dehydrogenase/5,10-methenyltetrahydrofolate cyclohydrolase [Candidatus Poseidoniales archaeon]